MLMTAQNLPSQNVSASLHHMLSTGVSINCLFQAQYPDSESVTKSRLAGSEKPQFPMAPRTKQPETLKMEEVLQAFQTAYNWKWHRNHAADPVGVSVSKKEQYLQAHKGLLMKLMEVSLVLNKLVIKQALECYDDAGLFSAGAKMEKSEFLDFQSYGFKVLLIKVRKKASRCTALTAWVHQRAHWELQEARFQEQEAWEARADQLTFQETFLVHICQSGLSWQLWWLCHITEEEGVWWAIRCVSQGKVELQEDQGGLEWDEAHEDQEDQEEGLTHEGNGKLAQDAPNPQHHLPTQMDLTTRNASVHFSVSRAKNHKRDPPENPEVT